MIPKVIHYCWFGRGEMPAIMKKCLKSWKKYCPDWEIVRWDEDRFDVNSTLWTKQAYEAKKYAFVADYVRIKALAECGGVYLDTDQELIKPLDAFLDHQAFMGFLGTVSVSAGVIGAQKEHPVIMTILRYYRDRSFVADGKYDETPNTDLFTEYLLDKGLKLDNSHQQVADVAIYPQTYFCPTTCVNYEDCTSKDTVSIHHWAMSWRSSESRRNMKRNKRRTSKWYRCWLWLRYLPGRILRRLFGDAAIDKIRKK